MQYTSLIAVATTLFAAQAPAQLIPRPYGLGPYLAPAMASPIPSAMSSPTTLIASPSPSSKASSMTPNWIAHWSMKPQTLATRPSSQSHYIHPSATPFSSFNHGVSHGVDRAALPFHPDRPGQQELSYSSDGFHKQEGNRAEQGSSEEEYPRPDQQGPASRFHNPVPDVLNMPASHGGADTVAPVDSMAPGSNVAPVQIQQAHGTDEGNSFCAGTCFASEDEAKCAKPYSSPLYKSGKGCWMCCITAPDF